MSSSEAGPAAAAPEGLDAQAVVQVEGLHKAYGPVVALAGVSFTIPAGQVVGFLGPNGAGKTTAMRIITGSLAADAGSTRVCGDEVERRPLAVKRRIGYLAENNPLYPELRVSDFLHFAAAARGLERARRRAAIERVVAATGLQAVFWRPIGDCSKGYRQRTGIAQALLHDPPLLILDEPSSGLDPLQAAEIRDLIRGLGRTKTVILCSHILPEVEALAQRVILLHRGRKLADAGLEDLRREPEIAVRVAARATAEDLAALLEAAGARDARPRAHSYGAGIVAAEARLASGGASLERLAEEAARRRLPLLELTPTGASLEAMFQRLVGEAAA